MTEEQVVNVRGEEISDDHRKIKANGVVHAKDDQNGSVGGDSVTPDLVADAGAASEEVRKANGDSHVMVLESEKNCKDAVSNGAAEETSETTTMPDVVSRESESERVVGQNGSGSVQSGVVESDVEDFVTDHDDFVIIGASDVQNGVVAEEGVGGDVNVNGVEECQTSAGAEVLGVVTVTVVEDDAVGNKSDRDFQGVVDVHNGAMEEETTTDENVGSEVQGGSESTSDKGVDKSEERDNVVSADVLDEKDIIANGNHDFEDGVEKNVVSADVSDEKDLIANGNHDLEDRVEKNEVTDVEGVSGTTDSKESAIEDARNSSEKAHVEPVSGVGADVQNSLAEPASAECTEDNGIPVEGKPDSKSERPEEESGSKLVSEAENSTALNTTDMTEDDNVVSDITVERRDEHSVDVFEVRNNAVDYEAEPSGNVVKSDGEPSVDVPEVKNDSAYSEAEASSNVVKSGGEPSVDVSEEKNNTEHVEAEASRIVMDGEDEASSNAVECDGEPSVDVFKVNNDTAVSEAEGSSNVVDREEEASSNAVKSDGEPSVDVSKVNKGTADSEAEASSNVVDREDEASSNAVKSDGEPSVNVSKVTNDTAISKAEASSNVVDREDEASSNAVKSDGEPSVDVSKVNNDTAISEAEGSSNVVDGEEEASSNAVKSGGEPSVDVSKVNKGTVDNEAEASSNVVDREDEASSNAVKSDGEPSVDVSKVTNDTAVSKAEASSNVVDREDEASSIAVKSDGEPSVDVSKVNNDTVDSEAEASSNVVDSEAGASSNAVKSDGEPSGDVVEIKNDAADSEVEPSSDAVKSDSDRSLDVSEIKNNAVESEAEPSDPAVQSKREPSSVSEIKNNTEFEAEPSNITMQSEGEDVSEMKTNAVEREAKPSNGAVPSEREPSIASEMTNNSVEIEAEPSNNTVRSEDEPSVKVSEIKTDATEREAEPSNGAVPSEREPSVVSEMTNNAVEFEGELSKSTVQSEAEPSVDESKMETNVVGNEAEPSGEGECNNHENEESRPATDAVDGQNMGSEVVKKPFYYLIRVPRYDDDENIKEQIKNALHQVEEKTKNRDAIRAETQTRKVSCKDCGQEVRAAITAERAARDLLKSKRQEMDSVQSKMNRLNNAISVGDIDDKIRNMEHMIQHETLPLNEEKQLIRQIKQLKHNRDELSSNLRKQDQSQQSVEDKDSIEEHFKHLQLLKKEMEVLRNNVLKAEATTKAARKKYDDECNKLNGLHARFTAADDIRQEAYAKLQTLKKQLHEKSKYFWEYRNAANKGQELAAQGKKEELQSFCVDQVERIMEMWNKNDEFRRDYVRCNTRSTLRRLQTLDGRSLGPDEEPPVIPITFAERSSKNNSSVSQSTLEQEKKSISTESVDTKDEPVSKVVVQRTEKSQTAKTKKPTKSAPLEKPVARWGDESDEDTKEEPVRTKEAEELILKAEKARKEEEEAKLKEQKRLEEIEKAKEALQRKKRNAEKAQQRAALKAQKEAEQKEKEREKRARKKERRKASSVEIAENTEQESAPSLETITRGMEECDQSEKPAEVTTKKPQKPSQFTRQTKAKSVPLALRNRGKRRIQPWMWVLIASVVVITLFYVGNSSTLRSSLEGFGF